MENSTAAPKGELVPGMFSFGIVCYRNWEYLTQTIDSVLMQDYSPIQLIVSDDGSGNFPVEEFKNYIETHKRGNVVSYVVRENERNEGTVRHLNRVLECMEGEYLMFMAGDDTLDNPTVFSRYVRAFEREGEDCGVVMAQTAMYDITMTNVQEYFVWPDVIDAINSSESSDALLKQLYYVPCIPTTSTCFRRWVIDQYAPFDTDYYLIEDYPFHIKLAEAHVKMRYENFVSARHRDGGISHGAVTALSMSKRRYFMDCIRAREKVLDSLREHGGSEESVSFNRYQISGTVRFLHTAGAGKKGVLRYARQYPKAFFLEKCQDVADDAFAKWLSLTLSFLLVLLFTPELCTVIGHVLPFLPVAALQGILTVLLTAATILCSGVTLLSAVMLWVKKISLAPRELL